MLVSSSRTRRRLDVFHSKHTERTFQRVTLAEVVAYFLQKCFEKIRVAECWRLTELNRKRQGGAGSHTMSLRLNGRSRGVRPTLLCRVFNRGLK
jgi:hypothetical protein